jgi:purine nucleosidase
MAHDVIIDCDPGVDDAVALLLAFGARDELNILGVTTVAGNVGAALTARNARVVCELAGVVDIPVFAGAERAIMGGAVAADHFHGVSGLGTLAFDDPRMPLARGRSTSFLVETLCAAAPASTTLAITGPMTNIALALLVEPMICAAIKEIVVMGGARTEGGNITASAEYNVYADPHAAAIVFASGVPVTAIGLDATHQVRTTPARIQALERLDSRAAKAAAELLKFSEHVERMLAGREGAPLHDPCTVAYLLKPELFRFSACTISVETASPLTRGHTAIEFRLDAPSETRWATDVDAEGVFDLLLRSLS